MNHCSTVLPLVFCGLQAAVGVLIEIEEKRLESSANNSALADNTWTTLEELAKSSHDFSYMCADTGSLCNFKNCTDPNSSISSFDPECRKDPFTLANYNASLLHCMCSTGQCAVKGSCVTGKCGKMGICYPTCKVNQYVDNHACRDCEIGTYNKFLDVISGSNTCCKAPIAGEYDVWYKGSQRTNATNTITCGNIAGGYGYTGQQIHFDNVTSKCGQPRDAIASMYILNTFGSGKYECLWQDGTTTTIKGSHYTGPDSYWGTVEYRQKTATPCEQANQ